MTTMKDEFRIITLDYDDIAWNECHERINFILNDRKDILEYNCLWYIKAVKPVYSVPLSALKEFYNQTGENSDPFGLYEVFL